MVTSETVLLWLTKLTLVRDGELGIGSRVTYVTT